MELQLLWSLARIYFRSLSPLDHFSVQRVFERNDYPTAPLFSQKSALILHCIADGNAPCMLPAVMA